MRLRHLAGLGLGCLAFLELGLRFGLGLGDPPLVTRDGQIEYRLLPSAQYTRYGNRIDINRFGMRSPDHTAAAQEDDRRVLLIGDSVIYGNHFLDQSETIAAQLMQALQKSPQMAGCASLVMAAAASSWGPVNQVAFVKETGLLDADVAVLVVSGHDLFDTPGFGDPVIPYRLRRSYGAIDDALQSVVERVKRRITAAPPPEPQDLRRAASLAALDQLMVQMQRAGIPLLLIYHPTLSERRSGLMRAHTAFENWAARNRVAFSILDDPGLTPMAYRDDIHPNAAGARVIARSLERMAVDHLRPCPV